jgi:hypothetical protein
LGFTKKTIAIPISISFGAMFLIFVYTRSHLSLGDVEFSILGGAFLLHSLAWVSWSLRIQHLSKGLGRDLSLIDALEALLPSLFFAGITPSSAGGEPLRIYILKKKGLSYGEATAVILGGRFLDVITITGLAIIALFLLRSGISSLILKIIHMALVFLIVGSCLLLIFISRPGIMKSMMKKIFLKMEQIMRKDYSRLISKLEDEIDAFYSSIITLMKSGKKSIAIASVGTLGNWILDLSVPWVIMLSLGIHGSLVNVMMIQLLVYIVVLLPLTPGSSGIAEGVAFALFSPLAPGHIMGMFVLAWRGVMYYFNLIAGSIVGIKVYKTIGRPDIL